jgi:hypothetical protein
VVAAPVVEEKPATKLCGKCMMFYGPIANNYLCSKCFKENGGVAAAPKQPVSKAPDSEMKDETIKAATEEE